MRKFLICIALLSIGFGAREMLNILQHSPTKTVPKKSEISVESTSSSVLSDTTIREQATVKRVIDGDTIELTDNTRIRYIGIDTPETVDPRKPVECFGKEAKEENVRLVDGKTIRLERDISEADKYGRLLRYVYVGEVMVDEALVRNGFAYAASFPPDIKYQETFRLAEREARESNRGLWQGCKMSNTSNASNASNAGEVQKQNNIQGCVIKGNISAKGEKIYHLPGCGSYGKTAIDESTGERWFCSEDEAQKAGWRKARNC